MKKVLLIPIIIGGALVVTGGVLLAISIANYEDNNTLQTKEYTDLEFNDFQINLSTADLEFKTSDDASKKVVVEEKEKEYHTVEVKDGTLKIDFVNNKKWYEFMDFSFKKMKVTVYMPAGEYGKNVIDVSTGDVKIPNDFKFTSLDAKASTGNYTVESNVVEYININTSTGKINLNALATTKTELKASTGDITLNKLSVTTDVKVKVSTGKVNLKDTSCANFTSKASTGDVTLTNSVIFHHVDVETDTGDVKFIDSDAETLKIKTDTGDVTGTLLTSKVFYVSSDTGKVDVPKSTTGGMCEVTTDTGDVKLSIKA